MRQAFPMFLFNNLTYSFSFSQLKNFQNCFLQKSFYCNVHSRLLSSLKQSIISDLSQDIDINRLKLERSQLYQQGKKVNIHEMIQGELEKRCLHFLNTLNPTQSRLLKAIKLEHSFHHTEGRAVLPPELMTNKNWIEALTCSSYDERLIYFLFTAHKYKEKVKQYEAESKIKQELKEEEENEDKSSLRIIDAREQKLGITRWSNHRLSSALMHGHPLILDMDFVSSMTAKEIGQTAKQLWMAYCANRSHPQPFHLIMTGCPPSNPTYRFLELRHLLDCDHFLATTTEKSYLDLYNPSEIVYLSPHAREPMENFDPSVTYVIAAYSDYFAHKRMALAKARQQKIKHQKFPIDQNIKWIQGSKDLYLNNVIKVLLAVKENETWKEAFLNSLPAKHFMHD